MKLRIEQLHDHLEQSLAPVYLLSGDEILQRDEAADAIRRKAREQGFEEREILHLESGFDWSRLYQASHSLSLFAQRRLLELRCNGFKFDQAGRQALQDYLASPPPDCVLLLIGGKLDKGVSASAWYKALDRAGVVIQVWPVDYAALPGWIERRARRQGLRLSRGAARILAERVEGNLLAASQEIDKLVLLCPQGQADEQTVLRVVADSAQYDVYALVDAALAGDGARFVRMLEGLRQAGGATSLVLWALSNEIRSLAQMSWQLGRGMPRDKLYAQFRVWPKRKAAVGAALARLKPAQCWRLLRRAARVDRVIKGQQAGNAWDELLTLGLALAGHHLVVEKDR